MRILKEVVFTFEALRCFGSGTHDQRKSQAERIKLTPLQRHLMGGGPWVKGDPRAYVSIRKLGDELVDIHPSMPHTQ